MKTASAKSKGRRLQDHVVSRLREAFSFLEEDDIKPAIMGESGLDVKLSPAAKTFIPFDIECKNTEKINIWAAIEQSEKNSTETRISTVVFKRNRSKVYCVLEFDHLIKLVGGDIDG